MMIAGKKKLLPREMQNQWDHIPENRKWLFQIVSNEESSFSLHLILETV